MKLINAEDRAKAFPEFSIPSRAVREGFGEGDMVKLIFLDEDGADVTVRGKSAHATGERMWVRVTGKKGSRYEGTLSNKPSFIPLAFGDTVTFGPEHIIDFKRLAS